jgi:hypothetical protein
MTTGWPPGLLQDDERKLSRWLASRPDALYQLRKNMTQDEINRMAREADGLGYIHDAGDDPHKWEFTVTELQAFAALAQAAERNKLASWMMAQGYATGHGDTTEDLLEELEREVGFKRAELWIKRISEAVLAEREACLTCYSPDDTAQDWADKIRARSKHHEQV